MQHPTLESRSMLVYLIRHADALPLGSEGVLSDSDRPLSEQGIEEIRALVGRLGDRFAPTVIGHSLLKRAIQTAEVIAQAMGESRRPSLVACDAMNPGGKTKRVVQFLRNYSNVNVALVGHNPDVEGHAARLIGSKNDRICFEKGAIGCIEFPDVPAKKEGALVWLVSPHLLAGSNQP